MLKRFSKTKFCPAQLSEEIELELRGRITVLEEKVDALGGLLLATQHLLVEVLDTRGE